jgi:hypothetical protein
MVVVVVVVVVVKVYNKNRLEVPREKVNRVFALG